MKKVFFITGALILIFLLFFLAGIFQFDNRVNMAVNKGNDEFYKENYEKALEHYKKGLLKKPASKELSYNAFLAAILAGKGEEIFEYLKNAKETVNKYLNAGNLLFLAGESIEDNSKKQELFKKSLDTYIAGIIKYPENVPLKYNYEYVKDKMEQQEEENEQENKEKQEEKKQEEDKEGQENESEQGDEENQEQKEDGGNKEMTEKGEQNKKEEEAAAGKEGESQEEEQQSAAEIQSVLRMLERQEQDSLKNNQEYIEREKETGNENDW
jgi:Ca-activated chloride channel family protein